MDLSALWSHERSRLSMQVDDVAGSSPSRAAAALHHGGAGAFDVSDAIAEERRDSSSSHHHAQQQRSLARTSGGGNTAPSASSTGASSVNHQQHQQVVVAPTPKRRSTVFAKRDVIFRKLVDESVMPAVNAVAAVQNFFDCNEFAMEYADRAPKRFIAAPTASATGSNSSSSSSASAASPSSSNSLSALSSVPGSTATAALASPQKREKRSSMAVTTPRAIATAAAARVHPSNSSTLANTLGARTSSSELSATATAVTAATAATAAAIPKTSFLSRKNGRKKPALEFSSARGAFRPYVGDMFSTRGEYIDGMLYMSRMKRSHQLTFGDVLGNGANARRLFGVGGSVLGEALDLMRSEGGRLVLKDAVSDALASSATSVASSAAPSTSSSPAAMTPAAKRKSFAGALSSSSSSVDVLDDVQTQQRRRCSLTLSNWSSNPENAALMVQEGVVEALIVLCRANDSVTRLHCVTALMNLSHVVELRSVIVRQGAVKTVAEIVDDTEDATLRTACAVTLCNLCCLEGGEEVLVEDGAVSALSVLIAEHPKVALLCRSALFNLTCVREPYPKIESVLKLFLSLTSSRGAVASSTGAASALASSVSPPLIEDCDEITAKALCNLSNFKRIRLRLMEEGVVNAIASLIHMHTPDIQEMLAYVLRNLSAVRACRSEMVAKGCMGTLAALTGVTSAVAAKLLIASTLFNLSKEPGNRLRMVFEGLLLLVNELCRGPAGYAGGEALRAVCARTLYNISCNDDTRVKLVERDGVSILSTLSRRSSDSDAKKMCTLALCNLLGVQQAAADIMNAGAITALIQLSMAPDQSLETKRLFAKALHGLCEHSETRDAVTRAGVIPALLYLSSISDSSSDGGSEEPPELPLADVTAALVTEIRARCTAALACLAADDALAVHVCNLQVVRCVTAILVRERSHVAIERFCCSCLSLLCRDEECAQLMADEGAVEVVLSTCMATQDLETKACCCHVLASMSCHASCCLALVRMGVISVLATLAKIKEDRGIQRCCAITLANLSVEPSIRDVLVTASIVAILALLSNSYSEESQRDCAKVLCNLSCVPGHEAHLVHEGAIGVLMMISMVRAVSSATKDTCARALFNLLNAETMKAMVHDGLVKVLPAFASLDAAGGASTSPSVASALMHTEVVTLVFMKLVEHPVGRNALCTERAALKALFALMERSGSAATGLQHYFESLLCELVFYDNSRLPSVHAGIIDALHKIAVRSISGSTMPDRTGACSTKRLALVLFTLAQHDDTRLAVASSTSLATLTTFLKRHAPTPTCASGECVVYAVSTFCSLAWHDSTRSRLEHPEVSRSLVQLLSPESDSRAHATPELGYYPAPAIKTTVLTLCCLSQSLELLDAMLHDRIIDALYGILNTDASQFSAQNAVLLGDSDFVALVCILFRQLSHAPSFGAMVSARESLVVPLLSTLTALVAPSDPDSSLDCSDALCSAAFAAVNAATQGLATATAGPASQQQSSSACASLVSPSVVKTIDALMTDAQLPETRWRCAASLWALSFVPELRARLVSLGCTRILVHESYRTESSVHLSILKCCAGALCNFTITTPPGDASANSLAAKMVEGDAVPALLALSKLENAEVREHCTLALTNLSGQSPKVEVGAVSALLSLSLQSVAPGSTSHPSSSSALHSAVHRPGSATAPHMSALCRPPVVCGDRHKLFSRLPEFAMAIERSESVGEKKFEADLVASTPPPPHLPTIPSELDASDNSHAYQAGTAPSEPEELLPQSASDRDTGDRGDDPRVLAVKAFAKVDPSESRLLGGGADTDDSSDDPTDPQLDASAAAGAAPGPDDARLELESRHSGNNDSSSNGADQDDASEQGETVGQLRKGVLLKGGSGAGYSLSPLSRVVVRKTQAAHAAKKFKELRARQVLGNNESASSLDSSGDVATSGSTSRPSLAAGLRGDSVNRNIFSSSKSVRAAALSASKSFDNLLAPSQHQQQSSGRRQDAPSSEQQQQLSGLLDARSSLAAAAAAARLYGAPPSPVPSTAATRSHSNSGAHDRTKPPSHSVRSKKRSEKVVVAVKTKAAAPTSKSRVRSREHAKPLSTIAKYLPAMSLSGSEDDDAESNHDEFQPEAFASSGSSPAIEVFREQAKKFGLWS